jgi:hypothetical protein
MFSISSDVGKHKQVNNEENRQNNDGESHVDILEFVVLVRNSLVEHLEANDSYNEKAGDDHVGDE